MNFKNSQIVDILSDRTKNYLGKYYQMVMDILIFKEKEIEYFIVLIING